MEKHKLFLTITLLLGLLILSTTQNARAEETYSDFFGQGNNNVDPSILNTQDEEDVGSQNQGWDGATGEVVPTPTDINIPEVGDPVPVETDE